MANPTEVDVPKLNSRLAKINSLRTDDTMPIGRPTKCTLIGNNGIICDELVPDDAPISACGRHLRIAYSYCQDVMDRATDQQLASLGSLPRLTNQQLIDRIRESRAVVYYALQDGHIKIGTTVHLDQRMKQLGANLVAVEPGSYDLEAQRHKQFADLRQGNTELFRPGKTLITHIATLQAG